MVTLYTLNANLVSDEAILALKIKCKAETRSESFAAQAGSRRAEQGVQGLANWSGPGVTSPVTS